MYLGNSQSEFDKLMKQKLKDDRIKKLNNLK
jgi:hypothetical protein